jgi:predicted adenylyl cyclase CyaB
MVQLDTYLESREGRLKIRVINDRDVELLFYLRPNRKGPRKSSYFRVPLDGGQKEMVSILKSAVRVIGSVAKERAVYYNENVRINIDRVKYLGDFVELEAELRTGTGEDRSLRLLKETIAALGLVRENAVSYSYLDLLLKSGQIS